jgi:hypothetical protein
MRWPACRKMGPDFWLLNFSHSPEAAGWVSLASRLVTGAPVSCGACRQVQVGAGWCRLVQAGA